VLNPISVRIPAGTQSGQVFHLRWRGLPRVNASGSGDLHVRVQLWTPQSLTDEQEALIKQLAEAGGDAPATRSKGIWSRMKEALGA
jgi:molecular chaperone DnaJ